MLNIILISYVHSITISTLTLHMHWGFPFNIAIKLQKICSKLENNVVNWKDKKLKSSLVQKVNCYDSNIQLRLQKYGNSKLLGFMLHH